VSESCGRLGPGDMGWYTDEVVDDWRDRIGAETFVFGKETSNGFASESWLGGSEVSSKGTLGRGGDLSLNVVESDGLFWCSKFLVLDSSNQITSASGIISSLPSSPTRAGTRACACIYADTGRSGRWGWGLASGSGSILLL
jgi:hypothetical protein